MYGSHKRIPSVFMCKTNSVKLNHTALYIIFFPKQEIKSLLSETQQHSQWDVRCIDININPARHTDGKARSTTQVPHQILQKQAKPKKQMLQPRSYNTIQSDLLPAAGWKQAEEAPSWMKTDTTTKMIKLLAGQQCRLTCKCRQIKKVLYIHYSVFNL